MNCQDAAPRYQQDAHALDELVVCHFFLFDFSYFINLTNLTCMVKTLNFLANPLVIG